MNPPLPASNSINPSQCLNLLSNIPTKSLLTLLVMKIPHLPQKFLPFLAVDLGFRDVILNTFSMSATMRESQNTSIHNSSFTYIQILIEVLSREQDGDGRETFSLVYFCW